MRLPVELGPARFRHHGEVMRERPELMGGLLGLRRDAVEDWNPHSPSVSMRSPWPPAAAAGAVVDEKIRGDSIRTAAGVKIALCGPNSA
jgi:hypothetical protein